MGNCNVVMALMNLMTTILQWWNGSEMNNTWNKLEGQINQSIIKIKHQKIQHNY